MMPTKTRQSRTEGPAECLPAKSRLIEQGEGSRCPLDASKWRVAMLPPRGANRACRTEAIEGGASLSAYRMQTQSVAVFTQSPVAAGGLAKEPSPEQWNRARGCTPAGTESLGNWRHGFRYYR